MEKVYFCSDCKVAQPLTKEPDEGDVCVNCNCDLFAEDPIVGQFDPIDARRMREE